VSKTSQSTLGELRKSFCFGRGTYGGEETILVKNVGAVQEILDDTSSVLNQGR